jgi:hypothetical protein
MKNNFYIRYSKNGHFIKGCDILPVKQPDNAIKAAPATAQAPKVLVL